MKTQMQNEGKKEEAIYKGKGNNRRKFYMIVSIEV
jgi:hypothetical protein